MGAVGGENLVVISERKADPGGAGFLAEAEMHRGGHALLAVPGHDLFLESSDAGHFPVQG
jgi:hypothetical protein